VHLRAVLIVHPLPEAQVEVIEERGEGVRLLGDVAQEADVVIQREPIALPVRPIPEHGDTVVAGAIAQPRDEVGGRPRERYTAAEELSLALGGPTVDGDVHPFLRFAKHPDHQRLAVRDPIMSVQNVAVQG
jgi:hypothetical protein